MVTMSGSLSCPPEPPSAGIVGEPIAGTLTFQNIMAISGWVCFGVTIVLWFGLAIPHLRRYKAPNEQRQILRIISMPVVFTMVALIVLHRYRAAQYVEPLANLYEAYAMASLFLLYVHYVAPEAHTREEFFQNLRSQSKPGNEGGSLGWFRRTWRIVFLYVLIYTILILLQEITQATGVYCKTSLRPRFAHVWLQTLELVTTVTVLITIVRFQRRLRDYMSSRNAFLKLIGFKLLVLLTTLQHFIFGILSSHVRGDSRITYANIIIGLPQLIICIECVIFMAGFYFTFHSKEYREHTGEARTAHGTLQALAHAINPIDLIRGVGLCFTGLDKP
ncbi:hypothetical protein CLAIMM_03525 [Cladophialophora immunda]|nr:hypothetical protein CLAIMM_03525 [Cladophialophora immunda]